VTDVVAVVLWTGVTFYAVFGGADFGAGFWDLVAGGNERGRRPRALIDAALAPVWEANHVWLIFSLVVLWTSFTNAFSSLMSTLFVPLTVAAFGIVLRGSGFAFLHVSTRLGARRAYGAVFAVSSLVTPFFLGTVAGAIASGRVPVGNARGDLVSSWVNPTSMLGGVLAVVTCAYLAATFLVAEARRRRDGELEQYFRARAIAAGGVAGAVALAGIAVLDSDSPHLFDRLIGVALPLVVLSALCGVGAIVTLVRGMPAVARMLAVGAVATVVGGWGVAQYPYLLGTHLSLDSAAAPEATLTAVLAVTGVAVLTCLPALVLLYALDQRGRLEGGQSIPSGD
jgi:cytochrome d ubiquinol oxidase subunit II